MGRFAPAITPCNGKQYFQLYKEAPLGGFPLREINAANDIFSKTGIRPVMIRTGP